MLILQTGFSATVLPVEDEGWVFPTEIGGQASVVCPVTGRFTAEFTVAPTFRVKVSGLGRSSTPADELMIQQLVNPHRGIRFIEISCRGHQAGHIIVHNVDEGGNVKRPPVEFLWSADGPHPLSPDAIYPSAP
jgi:hypothetical protein